MVTVNPYILGHTRYRVVAPIVVAKLGGGKEQYVYQHGILPFGTLPSHIEQLLGLGMVSEFGAVQS